MKIKKCWHKWDVFKEVRHSDVQGYRIEKTKKTCRKCDETRIKEKVY